MTKNTDLELKTLSEIIAELPKLQASYYRHFLKAVDAGTILALPTERSFQMPGQSRSYGDMMFELTPAFEEWHEQQLKRIELDAKGRKGTAAFEEDIRKGAVDFRALAEQFRKERKRPTTRRRKLKVKDAADVAASGTEEKRQQRAANPAAEAEEMEISTQAAATEV